MVKKYLIAFAALIIASTIAYSELTHFEKGMEAFNKTDFSVAEVEFKASVAENPSDIPAKFYYALSLYHNAKMNESRSEFRQVADIDRYSAWGIAALSYIQVIDLGFFAPEPEDGFSGAVTLAYDSESNIALNPSLIAEGNDIRKSAQAYAAYSPTLFSFRPIAFTFGGYGAYYDKNTAYDMNGGNTGVSLNLPFIMNSFLSTAYSNGQYYQKFDPYYSNDYAECALTFNVFGESSAWTRLYGSYAGTLYRNISYECYDCYNSVTGIRQYLNSLIYFQYEAKLSDARSNDYSFRSHDYELGAMAPFIFYHMMTVTYKYMNRLYLYDDSVGKTQRHDISNTFEIGISKDMFRWLSWSLKYSFVSYSSNLDKTESALGYGSYLDRILSLSISYKF